MIAAGRWERLLGTRRWAAEWAGIPSTRPCCLRKSWTPSFGRGRRSFSLLGQAIPKTLKHRIQTIRSMFTVDHYPFFCSLVFQDSRTNCLLRLKGRVPFSSRIITLCESFGSGSTISTFIPFRKGELGLCLSEGIERKPKRMVGSVSIGFRSSALSIDIPFVEKTLIDSKVLLNHKGYN